MKWTKIPTQKDGKKKVRLEDGFIVVIERVQEDVFAVNLPSIDPAITKFMGMPEGEGEQQVIIKGIVVAIKKKGEQSISIRAWRLIQ